MKKIIIPIVILLVLTGGVYYYQRSAKPAKAPVDENQAAQNLGSDETALPQDQNQATTSDPTGQAVAEPGASANKLPTPKPTTGTFSSGEEGMSPDVQVWEVVFDGSSFSPKSINIKLGDVVFFKNTSSGNFWPASDPHPSHTNYPEFDAKKAIPAGGKFQFQFTKAGNWGYHNHLNPAATGVINVSK